MKEFLFYLVCFLLIAVSWSTHFRGAIINWKLNPDGKTIDLYNRQSWRRTSQSPECNDQYIRNGQNYSEGTLTLANPYTYSSSSFYYSYSTYYPPGLYFSAPFLYQCTDYSLSEDWQSGRGRIPFTPDNRTDYYVFQFSGCCWIYNLTYGSGSNWNVMVKVNTTRRRDTGKMNTSPIVDLQPIQRLQYGCNHTIRLPVSDDDGDTVKCRWSYSNESAGMGDAFANAILDENTCTVTYSATYQIGWYAAAIQIEDYNYNISMRPLSSVPLQFLVSVEEQNGTNGSCTTYEKQRPKFVNLTLPDKACVGVKNDTDFSTTITIQSNSEQGIAELNTISPIGLVKSSLERSNLTGNWHINVKWNPNNTNTVNNIFCFTAVDDAGLSSDQRCITLLAGVPPANIIPSSKSPASSLVQTSQRWWSIQFDQESKAPQKSAYIYLHFVNGTLAEKIDAYNSSGVRYTFGANSTTLQFRTSRDLEPGQEYYFLFGQGLVQGKTYCGAESKAELDSSFWRFRTEAATSAGMSVRCFKGSMPVHCNDTYFNCTDNWGFTSPCTPDNILAGHLRFPHPSSSHKFILCDMSGKPYVAYCPPTEVFHARCSVCATEGQIFSSTCGKEAAVVSNPCTKENIIAGRLFFAYPGSDVKYIHCDVWGHPWEQECQHGEIWDQTDQTCIVPTTYDPCRQHGSLAQSLYPHSCDPHLFIHCDGNGQSFVQACQLDFVFLPASLTCVPQGFPGSEPLHNTCH